MRIKTIFGFYHLFSVFIIIGCVTFTHAFSYSNTAHPGKPKDEPIFRLDFDQNSGVTGNYNGFDKMIGRSYSIEKINDLWGKTFLMRHPNVNAYKKLNNPLTEGAYLMCLDFKRDSDDGIFYIRPTLTASDELSRQNVYETFTCSRGRIGYYSGSQGWNVAGIKKLELNKWYRVAMWIDLDAGLIYHYLDNEFRGVTTTPKVAHGFWFCHESSDANTVTYLDNIELHKVSLSLIETLNASGAEVPEVFSQPIDCKVGSTVSGNIFTDLGEVEFNIDCLNRTERTITFHTQHIIRDYKGDVVWTQEKKNTKLLPGESLRYLVQPKINRYDIYTMETVLKPDIENIDSHVINSEFSTVSVPTASYVHKDFGACIHISKNKTDWNKIKHSIGAMGIGWLRDDFRWQNYETEKGKYGFTGDHALRMNQFVNESVDMGIEILALWIPGNSLYGVSSRNVPKTEDQLRAMSDAAFHFAKEYENRIKYFEFGNELNHNRQEVMSCKEYAIALQYFYTAVKRANPDAVVVAGGFSRDATDWIRKMLEEGGKGYCDVISIHPYQEAGSPETKKWDVYCQQVRNMMDEIGYKHVELWTTEGNTGSDFGYNTEQQQGSNLIRQLAQCDAYNVQDKYMWYQMQTADDNMYDNEACFGILRGPEVPNSYGAKHAYLSVANYFARTEGAKFVDDIQMDNVWILRFQKNDGKYILMMYCDRGYRSLSLDLGATTGTLFDMVGNANKLTSDGFKYTFTLSDQPIYFEYQGASFVLCPEQISISDNSAELTKGDEHAFDMVLPPNTVVTTKSRDNLSIGIDQVGNKARLTVQVLDIPRLVAYTERRQNFGTQLYTDFLDVYVWKNNELISKLPIAINYVKNKADVRFYVEPQSLSQAKWLGVLEISNNSSMPLSGEVTLASPIVSMENDKSRLAIEGLLPKRQKILKFDFPAELISQDPQVFAGILELKTGEQISFSLGDHPRSYGYRQNRGTSIKYLKKAKDSPPVIDGEINSIEWESYKITDFDKSQVKYGASGVVIAGVVEAETFSKDQVYEGKSDFSGTIYAQWDRDYLYVAAVVHDDIHYSKEDPLRFYLDDVFYIQVCPTMTQRHNTRIDIALTDFFDDNKGRLYRNWSEMFDVVVGGVIPESDEGVRVDVKRVKNTTNYEARIPWSEILSQETLQRKNFSLTFGIRDYDGDRDKYFNHGGWYCLVE